MALRNRELHARNDDDDCHSSLLEPLITDDEPLHVLMALFARATKLGLGPTAQGTLGLGRLS